MIKQERVEDLYREYCAKAHEEIFGNNKIAELIQQLAEKDKEIEELKAKQWHSKIDLRDEILNKTYREFNWLFKNDKNYVNLMNIVDNAIDNYESNQRHQICEKIREWCQENWDYDDFMYFLNKLEKGESDE